MALPTSSARSQEMMPTSASSHRGIRQNRGRSWLQAWARSSLVAMPSRQQSDWSTIAIRLESPITYRRRYPN